MIAITHTALLNHHGHMLTYQVDAWQSGPLGCFSDPLYSGFGKPRWQIRHLPTDTWITESPDQVRAELAITKLLKSKIDWNFGPAPDVSCFHAALALEPLLKMLRRKRLITPLAVNLAEAGAARARLRLALEEDLPADVRETLGLVEAGVILKIGIPATYALLLVCGDHRWDLTLDRTWWSITPFPQRLDEHQKLAPQLRVGRKNLAGHMDDLCYDVRRSAAAG
jgi:hypothetical protein